MATLREKLGSLLDSLSEELLRGYRCLLIAREIRDAQGERKLAPAAQFFSTVQEACMREAFLSVAKLAISERESITIEYLVNAAGQVPSKFFPFATREEIDNAIEVHRGQLEELTPVIDDLKLQRDRVLAHLDRKHVNEPETISSQSIESQQIERCFDVFLGIINTYRRYFGETELGFEQVVNDLREEVGYLVERLQVRDYEAGQDSI
jgi:hypothetical protein